MQTVNKIDDKDLMSFEDFSKLSSAKKLKVKGRSVIITNDRLARNTDFQTGKAIRKDLLDFAEAEIKPLLEVGNDLSEEQTNHKAFNIALKIFMIHDPRLKSSMTLEAISAIFDITRQRVKQIEDHATAKLKQPKKNRDFRRYLNL